jgi:hypothetical protein
MCLAPVFPTAPKGMPQRGYRTQPRVLTPGTVHPGRRALKGRQIEFTNNVEIEFKCGTSQLRTPMFATIGCEIINSSGIPSPFRAKH